MIEFCKGLFRPAFLVTYREKQILRCSRTFCKRNMESPLKISSEQLEALKRPGVVQLANLFEKNGFELRLAGGAVRDLLMGKTPKDLDFATTATPFEMKNMFVANEIRMINMKGEKHGTITARLEEENFECTTLRIDKITDGRHAEVEFIKDWALDAGRRDLTVNAVFLGLDGSVYDYFNGVEHMKERKIIFVGDCDQRLREDYLRILRYFRFYGRIAKVSDNHDPGTIECIKKNAPGLAQISGERIWVELKKIVSGRFGEYMLDKIIAWGVGKHIGLTNFDTENVHRIYENFHKAGIDTKEVEPCLLLAAGFEDESDALDFVKHIKPSNKERDVLLFVIRYRTACSKADFRFVKHLVVDLIYKEKRTRPIVDSVVKALLLYTTRTDLIQQLEDFVFPKFPIKGGMLLDHVSHRREIKTKMDILLDRWKESDLTMDSDELISSLSETVR